MGCCLTKTSSKSVDMTYNPHAHDTKNALHRPSKLVDVDFKSIATILLSDPVVTDSDSIVSLTICPSSDQLTGGHWTTKKTLVSGIKNRYCVLGKSDIKFYQEELKVPPFGKGLTGRITLLGAVILSNLSEDGSMIDVEIFENGDKNAHFSLCNNPSGQEFLIKLEWAIRKITLSVLSKAMKTPPPTTGKVDEKLACTQWLQHHKEQFSSSVDILMNASIVHFINIEENGEILVRPGLLRMWTAFGENFFPHTSTESIHMGLGWKLISPQDLSKYMNNTMGVIQFNPCDIPRRGASTAEAETVRVITFDDILDVTYKHIDPAVSAALSSYLSVVHHTDHCAMSEYIVITISTIFGHNLHLLACCLHDYNDLILALRNVLLFAQQRTKLEEGHFIQTSGIEEASKHAAAAVAIRLFGE